VSDLDVQSEWTSQHLPQRASAETCLYPGGHGLPCSWRTRQSVFSRTATTVCNRRCGRNPRVALLL